MASPTEVRHTSSAVGEINLALNADTRVARSRAISRFSLRERAAPGHEHHGARSALLARAGERLSGVPTGSRPLARALLPARDLPAVPGHRRAPRIPRWLAGKRRVGWLAGTGDSRDPVPRVGLVGSL